MDVVTKIAAGEVIERPASVVKELLENSVDAGSTRIDVDIDQGGIDAIRVADNGSGVLPEDLPLAFASHATSKLSSAEDLFRIDTLGFRGEALASIGGVAQVRLQSRAAGQSSGAEVSCQGGELSAVEAWNGSPGTRVEVLHLFYNTPVRRKFLRTAATEMGHVSETFTRLALARPDLHLTLRHNDKAVYEVPVSAELADRVTLFFGKEVREALYPVEVVEGPLRLRGFVADPACERGNAKLQYIFVNGRWIRDRSLGHALQEAYRGLLMTARYAVAFLFIDVPPDQVDVNVHPTKSEIRFRQSSSVYQLVFRTVRERLRQQNLTARLHVPAYQASSPGGNYGDRNFFSPRWTEAPRFNFQTPAAAGQENSSAWPQPEPTTLAEPVHPQQTSSPALTSPVQQPESARPKIEVNLRAGSDFSAKAIQLYDAYLVLETPEGMLVIDQHALHERILFEQLRSRTRSGTLEKQRLLIPETIDLTAEHNARTLEQKEALAELGLEIEDFGGGTLLLTSYPAILGNRSPASTLRAVIDYLISNDRVPDREQLLNDMLSLMACHAAVRAGDRLTPEEISALLAQRDLIGDTHHCPHGRPTCLLLSRQELDRQFRRT
jgi:DNA mismatch repair protein MutL